MAEKRRISRKEERARRAHQYDESDFYDGVDFYNYDDDGSSDNDDFGGYDDRERAPKKSQLARVKDLESAFPSLPKPSSTTLGARIKDLEEIIKKPDNVDGVSTDDRIRALEEAYSGVSRSNGGSRAMITKLEDVEKELTDLYVVPDQLEDRVVAAEKAAGIFEQPRRGRIGIPERVDKLYREVIGKK